MVPNNRREVDVVVIGGGAAGLNGALVLARSRRSVTVVDSGSPRNSPADAVHGLFARDGIAPAELLAAGRDEVRRYGGDVVTGEVIGVRRGGPGFEVALADGTRFSARRLLIATGLTDVLPDVAGLTRLWGHDVVHCPYCHGYEVRDRAIGVLSAGAASVHQALLFRQLSDDITFFSHRSRLGADAMEQFEALGIEVVSGPVAEAETIGDHLTALRMTDGRRISRDVLAVASRMEARAGFLDDVGLEAAEHASGMGHHIPADAFGVTAVPGVWVAGNVTDLTAQVGAAAAGGALAAAHLNADLVAEGARAAVHAFRSTRTSHRMSDG